MECLKQQAMVLQLAPANVPAVWQDVRSPVQYIEALRQRAAQGAYPPHAGPYFTSLWQKLQTRRYAMKPEALEKSVLRL